MDDRRALRTREAAAALGVTPETVRAWVRAGDLHGVRVGHTLLIPLDELDRVLASRP